MSVPLKVVKNCQKTESGSYCAISDNEFSSVTLNDIKTGNERQKIILQLRDFNSGQSISKT